jgi:hypothetical protein
VLFNLGASEVSAYESTLILCVQKQEWCHYALRLLPLLSWYALKVVQAYHGMTDVFSGLQDLISFLKSAVRSVALETDS